MNTNDTAIPTTQFTEMADLALAASAQIRNARDAVAKEFVRVLAPLPDGTELTTAEGHVIRIDVQTHYQTARHRGRLKKPRRWVHITHRPQPTPNGRFEFPKHYVLQDLTGWGSAPEAPNDVLHDVGAGLGAALQEWAARSRAEVVRTAETMAVLRGIPPAGPATSESGPA